MNKNALRSMNIVIVGHVDHGKSTVIGRLLADTGSLPEGKLEALRELCRRNAKPFEYAFLLDALKDERNQGITIDTARCFFHTDKRRYIIIDAPGHIEFLKNMISGASRAEAALLVIDAAEGVRENSRRHGYMLAMLGIRQMAVIVNKMDLVGYDRERYEGIVEEYGKFLREIGVEPTGFIPASAAEGDNIASKSENMPWYGGKTVLETLDAFESESPAHGLPFRMPVQDVYKFTSDGDDRRIVAGSVETGGAKIGDRVVFYPSGKSTTIKTVEAFNSAPRGSVSAGEPSGFTMTEQIYVKRGELACVEGERAPLVAERIRASVFWLGKRPFSQDGSYYIKLGSAKVPAALERVVSVLDSSTLERAARAEVGKNQVADVIIRAERPIAFDLASEMPTTGRFVLVDRADYEIAGGGIVNEALDGEVPEREAPFTRNRRWEQGSVTPDERAMRGACRPTMVLVTSAEPLGGGNARKEVAKALERLLWDDGRPAYYAGFASLLYGVDADIERDRESRRAELFRRVGECANLLLDAGHILIVTAAGGDRLTATDVGTLRSALPALDSLVVAEIAPEDAERDAGASAGAVKPDISIELAPGGAVKAARAVRDRLARSGRIFTI